MTSEGIKKEIGVARIAFEGRFRAFVGYQSPEENPLSRERDLIQVFILSLTRVLFLLGENKQAPLLLQFIQQAMGDTVTPQGLKRPTITAKGQDLLAEEPQASEYSMTLRLIQNEDGAVRSTWSCRSARRGIFIPPRSYSSFNISSETWESPPCSI